MRRRDFRRNFLTGAHNPGNLLSHWDYVTLLGLHPSENAVRRSFDFEHSFVGLHLEKWLSLDDGFAFFFSPSHQFPGFLAHFESGHHYAEGHIVWENPLQRCYGTTPFSFFLLAAIILSTCSLGGASVSRVAAKGPFTVT